MPEGDCETRPANYAIRPRAFPILVVPTDQTNSGTRTRERRNEDRMCDRISRHRPVHIAKRHGNFDEAMQRAGLAVALLLVETIAAVELIHVNPTADGEPLPTTEDGMVRGRCPVLLAVPVGSLASCAVPGGPAVPICQRAT